VRYNGDVQERLSPKATAAKGTGKKHGPIRVFTKEDGNCGGGKKESPELLGTHNQPLGGVGKTRKGIKNRQKGGMPERAKSTTRAGDAQQVEEKNGALKKVLSVWKCSSGVER